MRKFKCRECGKRAPATSDHGSLPHRCLDCKRRPYCQHNGITPERMQELIDGQDGRCAECGEPFVFTDRHPRLPRLDHDEGCCPGRNSCGRCVTRVICRQCHREPYFRRLAHEEGLPHQYPSASGSRPTVPGLEVS